ncbi:hypothetical protein Cgig2_020329 [Carnegiea gigantea]|uniref:BHLH domain-containing protein n=1 Tax=Carnegiea gigantea TaxID=171969 RepID=A0A9Q1KCV9_9CARY|nr:hypothetical protein Cgig2_020329 [Carnegiea gigantea]
MFMGDDMNSSGDWLSDLAMEDPASITHHCQLMMMMMMNSQDNNNEALNDDNMSILDPSDLFFEQEFYTSSSKANQSSVISDEIATNNVGAAEKEVKAKNSRMIDSVWSGCTSASSCSQLISFGSSNGFDIKEEPVHHYGDHLDGTNHNHDDGQIKPKTRKRPGAAMPLCTQEHVIAERKRREVMTQRFLALSALIPGLKKMDKASILGNAAKYLKQLEERVKLLEEQTTKRIVESVVIAKRTQDTNIDDENSSISNEDFHNSNPLFEIEARASNKNVLIRIHSQKDQGLAQRVLNEIEKLHLTTLNYNTAPFGNYAMNITIIAQMDDEFDMKMKDLALHLRLRLQKFLCLEK